MQIGSILVSPVWSGVETAITRQARMPARAFAFCTLQLPSPYGVNSDLQNAMLLYAIRIVSALGASASERIVEKKRKRKRHAISRARIVDYSNFRTPVAVVSKFKFAGQLYIMRFCDIRRFGGVSSVWAGGWGLGSVISSKFPPKHQNPIMRMPDAFLSPVHLRPDHRPEICAALY